MPLSENHPCPCGSNRATRACCLRVADIRQRDGTLAQVRTIVVPQANPAPTPPQTGQVTTRCYAAPLHDCAGNLEGEHYISHRMLQLFAGPSGMLTVQGIDPRRPELTRRVPTKTMTADVLCARHNRALLPIDTAGNRFFESIHHCGSFLEDSAGGVEKVVAVNGHDFERWCLKALCGIVARGGEDVPELWSRILFGRNDLISPRGMYVYASEGDVMNGRNLTAVEARIDGAPIGLIVHMLQQQIFFSMHPETPLMQPEHVGKWRVYRPQSFTVHFPANRTASEIWLSWQDSLYHAPIQTQWSPEVACDDALPSLT